MISLDGLERGVGEGGDHRAAGGRGPRPGRASNTSCATGCSPPALLGRAVPDRLRRATVARTRCRTSTLPVELPDVPDYSPVQFDPDDADSEPSPPLGKATEWVHVELDLGDGLKPYTRDTNVMPQWAGSSWYELRYADPHNSETFCAKENEAYWMGPRPAEHGPDGSRRRRPLRRRRRARGAAPAVLAVLAQGALRPRPRQLRASRTGGWSTRATSRRSPTPTPAGPTCPPRKSSSATASSTTRDAEVNREFGKIGKSLKNSVSPDEICEEYGADTLRVYEMSMGPLEASRPWATKDVVGAYRFLQRVWRVVVDESTGDGGSPMTSSSTRDDAAAAAQDHRRGRAKTMRHCATTPRRPS